MAGKGGIVRRQSRPSLAACNVESRSVPPREFQHLGWHVHGCSRSIPIAPGGGGSANLSSNHLVPLFVFLWPPLFVFLCPTFTPISHFPPCLASTNVPTVTRSCYTVAPLPSDLSFHFATTPFCRPARQSLCLPAVTANPSTVLYVGPKTSPSLTNATTHLTWWWPLGMTTDVSLPTHGPVAAASLAVCGSFQHIGLTARGWPFVRGPVEPAKRRLPSAEPTSVATRRPSAQWSTKSTVSSGDDEPTRRGFDEK